MTKFKRLGLVFLMMYVAAIFVELSWCGYSISNLLPIELLFLCSPDCFRASVHRFGDSPSYKKRLV